MSRGLFVSAAFAAWLMSVGFLAAAPKKLSDTALAARIDAQLDQAWKKKGNVVPAPQTDDAAFIRRVYLDLAGRIPNILEVRDFLDDDRADKRQIWVDSLLRGLRKDKDENSYADHFAAVWGDRIVPHGGEERGPYLSYSFQAWLRQQLKQNVPYNDIVRGIIQQNAGDNSFYQAHENKPENLAAATARVFLGIRLECAQCHDDRSGGLWSREQFWELAAFFTPGSAVDIPGTKRRVTANFLDGKKPEANPADAKVLAEWLTATDNAFFARATANFVWEYLFGIGLVEPADGWGEHNPPSHPELLDELALQFVLNKYDLKYLLRALVLTQAYQRSSLMTHPSQEDPRLFARALVRGLSPGQLFDSVAETMEYRAERFSPNPYLDPSRRLTPREEFVARFTTPDKRTEMQTSILQALFLMNGPFISRAVNPETNRTLASLGEAAKIETSRRLETLFLVILTRKPTEAEVKRYVPYLDKGGPTKNQKKAMADLFWALLNSGEFRLNH